MAQIKVISFLALNRNLFESSLKIKWHHLANDCGSNAPRFWQSENVQVHTYVCMYLEIFIRSASNLAQIKVISFLTFNRNLFESSLEKKWRHVANDCGSNAPRFWQSENVQVHTQEGLSATSCLYEI